MVDWSELPEELLGLISVRLFSAIELKRFRSICTSWRRSCAPSTESNPFRKRRLIRITPLLPPAHKLGEFLSRASFFRVTLSSSPDKGWLIKFFRDFSFRKNHLLEPLSRLSLKHWKRNDVDLLEYTVSEIRESYVIHNMGNPSGFKRLVLVEGAESRMPRVLGVGCDGKIWYWYGEKVTWKEIKDDQKSKKAHFSDIILHKGIVYVVDSKGRVWWISSSLQIFRFGPLQDSCCCTGNDRRSLVECCGELYVIDRLLVENFKKRNANTQRERNCLKTLDFKVYKMDSLGKLEEVSSLGDKAIVMATDSCLSVLAHEYYGCVQNSIYFTDNEEHIKVFKLEDGSIKTMAQGSFEMFVPSFLSKEKKTRNDDEMLNGKALS